VFVSSLATGTTMALDAEPNPAGNVIVTIVNGVSRGKVLAGQALADQRENAPGELFSTHQQTCAAIHEWRPKGRRR
jgi:hypothetical protein